MAAKAEEEIKLNYRVFNFLTTENMHIHLQRYFICLKVNSKWKIQEKWKDNQYFQSTYYLLGKVLDPQSMLCHLIFINTPQGNYNHSYIHDETESSKG